MGQPSQGQGAGAPGGGWGPPPQRQAAPPPPPRGRFGLWFALACAATLLVMAFLAVTGGVFYLAGRDAGGDSTPPEQTSTGPEPLQFQSELFTFTYPGDWFDITDGSGAQQAGGVAEVADEEIDPEDYDEFATNSVTVYVFDSEFHALVTCRNQAGFLGFGGDEVGDPEELEPIALAGEELPAHRVLGTHDGRDAVSEMYCLDIDDDVLQIVVETHGATELSPEIRALLDSWTWASG